MNTKKVITWAVIAFLLYFLIAQPTQSAGAVNGVLDTLRQAAEAVITFMQNLFV